MGKTYVQALADLKKEPYQYAATVAGQIERIDDAKVVIVNKLVEMRNIEANSQIDDAALSLDEVSVFKTGVTDIAPGQSYTIPEGYYAGAQVHATTEGGDLNYQSKTVTPTKSKQVITPDEGHQALSDVTVEAIPAKYQDVTPVTAKAADVLTGTKFVNAAGEVIDGAMANWGAKSATLDAAYGGTEAGYTHTEFVIPQGYHNGEGRINIVIEEKTADPTEEAQEIIPSEGKVLGKVTVNAINKTTYLKNWTADADASAANILLGKTAYVNGAKVSGTMANNGAVSHVLDCTEDNDSFAIAQGYHSGTGTVSIVKETKTVTAAQLAAHEAITLTPTAGKVISGVTIEALDKKYQDVSAVTATKDKVLVGSNFVNAAGEVVGGTMANNGDVTAAIDVMASGSTGASISLAEGYIAASTISISSAVYDALAAI